MSNTDNLVPIPLFENPEFLFAGSRYSHEGECGGYFCTNGCYRYKCGGCGRGTNRLYASKCPSQSCQERLNASTEEAT